ncbi:Non-specific serine/threonine protein kinase protein [Dioscorea alata]|uniref:Non-specific serine/threonine protein kinase protein n=1 Tax=Dioscorea alata TaxID=55571 RepID=A0ACB7UDW8_DIOAL|nr:Non-specific serine/threonine protein kinase protein [Dioscorea alata]
MAEEKKKKEEQRSIFLQCLLILLLLLLHCSHSNGAPSLSSDLAALLTFKSLSDSSNHLLTWNSSSPFPCSSWLGVSCSQSRITGLVLESLSLSGASIAPLSNLTELRILNLKSNHLTGPIPDLSSLAALKLLFLSNNSLSGPIPSSLSSLSRLYRLDLSFNLLSGPIPLSLNHLPHLLTLRLNSNNLSGPIPVLSLPNLQDLNLSSNSLTGPIPPSLSSFPPASFAGNPTGFPTTTTVSSSPGSKPDQGIHHSGMSHAALIAIIAGDLAALLIAFTILFLYFWRKIGSKPPSHHLHEGEKIVFSSSPYAGFERGRMVFFDETPARFELEDLLRASAEMLGKGGYGTAYKAVIQDKNIVAVKRLRETGSGLGKREFEQRMQILGRIQHPNLVSLKAYYYAPDEKLLVYEFMPGGSVYALLHGNRGPGRTPVWWEVRLRVALAAARALAHIHTASRSLRLAHGNVKTTNILLDKAGTARLSDFGLSMLGPSSTARDCGYRAPEAPSAERPWASQRADVYAFGVVLLELLTGRAASEMVDLPRWVQSVVREEWTAEVFDLELLRCKGIEEQMVTMLQLALGCTATVPDQRPKIRHVVRMIEDISSGGIGDASVSPSLDSFDSVSDSPSLSEESGQAHDVTLSSCR